MIKTICDVSQIDKVQWEDLLRESSYRNAFQTLKCYEFYCSLSFMESFIFAVCEDDVLKGVIVGYIQKDGGKIKQFFSRRAIINGGPLITEDISELALEKLLFECRTQLKKKAIYVEMRNYNDYSKYKNSFINSGFIYEQHYNFHVDCLDKTTMWHKISESKRRQINKAIKSGVYIVEATTEMEIRSFYCLLSTLYKEKVKTPLVDYLFFSKFYSSGLGKILLVKFEDNVIGGILCPILNCNVIYEWFVVGMDNEYKSYYPSVMATWAAIDYACSHGIERFDFMGAGAPNDGGYGVRDFKAKFGGELVEHGRFKCVNNKLLYEIGKLGVELLKKKK